MNVLVTYFSQTGNTEQIPKAIHEEVSSCSSSILKKIDVLSLSSIYKYGPIHDFIRKSKQVTDDEWSRMVIDMLGHPDRGDLLNAGKFAGSVINEIYPD